MTANASNTKPKLHVLYPSCSTCALCQGPAVPLRAPRSVQRYRFANTLPPWMHDTELLGVARPSISKPDQATIPVVLPWVRYRPRAAVTPTLAHSMKWILFHHRCLDLAIDMLRHLNLWAAQGWLGGLERRGEDGKNGEATVVDMADLALFLEGEGGEIGGSVGWNKALESLPKERELTVVIDTEYEPRGKLGKFWWARTCETQKWLTAVPDSLPAHKRFMLPQSPTPEETVTTTSTADTITTTADKSKAPSKGRPKSTKRPRTFIDPPVGSFLAQLTPDFTLMLLEHVPPTVLPNLSMTHPCFANHLRNAHRSPQLNAKWKECVLAHFGYALWPWEWVERDEEAVPLEGKGSSRGLDWAEMWRSCWDSAGIRNTLRLADKVEIAWRVLCNRAREAKETQEVQSAPVAVLVTATETTQETQETQAPQVTLVTEELIMTADG